MNNVAIVGRLAATPELKNTTTGHAVINFCVAVKGAKDTPDWIDCVAWEDTARFVSQYFKKGNWIEVTGSIQTRMYEDRNGKKQKTTEVLVYRVGFCGTSERSESKTESKTETVSIPVEEYTEIEEGDLPF